MHLTNIKNKLSNHKRLIFISLGICALFICISLAVFLLYHPNAKNTYLIDVNKTFKIETSGINGQADASIDYLINDNTLIENILTSLYPDHSYDYATWDHYQQFLGDILYFCNFNKREQIENGDRIIATVTFDKKEADQLHLKLKNCKIQTVVSGLTEIIDSNTQLTDQLKSNLDKEFFNNIQSYLKTISPSYGGLEVKEIDRVWRKIVDYSFLTQNAQLEKDPVLLSKYRLDSTSNPNLFSQFVYICEVDLEATSLIHNEPIKEVCYITVSNDSAIHTEGEKVISFNASVDINHVYKTLDEAKKSVLNQDGYHIEEIN